MLISGTRTSCHSTKQRRPRKCGGGYPWSRCHLDISSWPFSDCSPVSERLWTPWSLQSVNYCVQLCLLEEHKSRILRCPSLPTWLAGSWWCTYSEIQNSQSLCWTRSDPYWNNKSGPLKPHHLLCSNKSLPYLLSISPRSARPLRCYPCHKFPRLLSQSYKTILKECLCLNYQERSHWIGKRCLSL